MKMLISFTFSLLISGMLFLNSCVEPVPPTDKLEVILVSSNITTPTTWASDKAYVIQSSDFYVESTLTIEPGAVVKFSSQYAYMTLGSEGSIHAVGTSEKPIIFTSIYDDENGGDSNDDGDATTPQAENWATIDLNGTAGSVFNYCEFRYGGKGYTPEPTLNLSANAEASIENCKFIDNGGGIRNSRSITNYIGVLHAESANNQTIIRNNLFYRNTLPLVIFSEINIDNSNSFSYYANSNTMNGIFVSGVSMMKTTNWQETEVAFVITSGDLSITEPYKLVLGNNVVLKFVNDSRLNCGGGEIALENHGGDGVFFTSYKDDTYKGDTNGDGINSSPAEADWIGIFLDDYKGGFANWPNILYEDPDAIVKKAPIN